MTDTLTTITTQAPTWDATTPGGYALLLILSIIATAWHANLWNGQ